MNTTEFNNFCDRTFAALLQHSPEVAGELGVRTLGGMALPQDRFSDISAAGIDARAALMRDALAQLTAIDPASLDAGARLSHRVLTDFLQHAHFGRLRGTTAGDNADCELLLNHLNGVQAELITCLTEWHGFYDRSSLDDYLQRLQAIPRVLTDLQQQLAARLPGNRVPACILRRVISGLDEWLAASGRDCNLFIRFAEGCRALHIDAAAADTLQQQALDLLKTAVFPAYTALRDWLRDEYPHDEADIGLCRLPGGSARYRFLLRAATTCDMTPEEIHELGSRELADLQASMRGELDRLGYRADNFAAQLRAFESDPAWRIEATGDDALLALTESIIDETRAAVLDRLNIAPRGKLVVKLIPPQQRANRHSLYTPGAVDGTRPGVFYLNPDHIRDGSIHGLTTLTYHETFPGHHVQLTIAQELGESLPEFRRILVHDAYIEGWAKYAEVMPWLEAFNGDPAWNLSRKRNELYSTANLVIDTGIHHHGWDRERAIAFFIDATAADESFAAMIIDRIVAVPGQVCAYKIGMLKVLNARKRMQQALAERFDVRQFHDAILRNGSLPLALLDEQVEAAIEALRS